MAEAEKIAGAAREVDPVEDQRRADARAARGVEEAPALRPEARPRDGNGSVAAVQSARATASTRLAESTSPSWTASRARPRRAKEKLVVERPSAWPPARTGHPPPARSSRLMDQWRQAGRAGRSDDDALWARFKAAQDAFFAAKDAVVAKEEEELPGQPRRQGAAARTRPRPSCRSPTSTQGQAALRGIQDTLGQGRQGAPRPTWSASRRPCAGSSRPSVTPRSKRWASSNPEAAARARAMVDQLETAVAGLREDLAKARGLRQRRARSSDAQARLRGAGAVAGPGPRGRRGVRRLTGVRGARTRRSVELLTPVDRVECLDARCTPSRVP